MNNKWDNIEIINENQLPSHATFSYDETLNLNGIWKFKCGLNPDKADINFISDSYDLSGFDDMTIPTCWQTKGYSSPHYFGAGFPSAISKSKNRIPQINHKKTYYGMYKKEFTLSKKAEGSYILCFDSVKSAFYCYLNEQYVGLSKGSMLPCEFDVTKQLRDGKNIISVFVTEYSDATYIEDQDMWFLAGIYRDVKLYHRPASHFEDIYLHSELTDDYQNAILHCDVKTSCKDGNVTLEINNQAVTEPLNNKNASLSINMENVRLWSAEKPNLYDVKVTLNTENGEKHSQNFRFGFREDKVDHQKAIYLHNGKPIKLRGINYHSFTPDEGYYVSEEVYRNDLKLLKEANINAIRTSHYPQAEVFYDLCDEMGFYVMDECNVESHGVREKGVPGDDEKWGRHVIDRMERMVRRDCNHACVSIWSLGNESACGKNHFKMKETALMLDDSRPIHYEGGRNLELSDFLCDGYCSTERERKFANKEDVKDKPSIVQRLIPLLMSLKSITYEEYKNHPILVTEYNHSMGNTGSDVEEHIRIMDQADQYCGGFVWDFKDKSLLKDGKLTYGGDWGVKDQGSHFCCNGITDPFSKPHSVYYEIQHAFQPVVISKAEDNHIRIYNRNFFTSTNEYHSYYVLSRNGMQVEKKEFKTNVAPRETKEYDLKVIVPTDDATYDLAVFFEKDGTTSYQQFRLKEERIPVKNNETIIKANEQKIIINDRYIIDRSTGDLTDIICEGHNLLTKPLRPSLFRPYTDGDVGFIGLSMKKHLKLDNYGRYSIDGFKNPPTVQINRQNVTVVNAEKEITMVREYSFINDKLHVSVSYTLTGKKAPNRLGMQLNLDNSFKTMQYFGKGPEDHYPGKDEGGLIGIYTQDIKEQDEYCRPQEHGNKSHVNYADISSKEYTLSIDKDDKELNVSFWPYTLKDLHEASHISDLPEHTTTTVNIDCLQNGLSDCFVKCDDKYLIKPGNTYNYSFYISAKKV
ncbi:MAG: hypothetical protein IJJ19_07515 [Erysipelotrichaceae bacterium]|nr:hypothetical protein [Erysipelotrichaceae bacterium]